MPSLREILNRTTVIEISPAGPPVEETVAQELRTGFCPAAQVRRSATLAASPGTVRVAVVADRDHWRGLHPGIGVKPNWMLVRVGKGQGLEIYASAPHLLFHLSTRVTEEWSELPAENVEQGRLSFAALDRLRPSYDSFLTQHARTARNFKREEHLRNLARLGFSHAEVNALAFAVPFERGPRGEVLHRFYTYCPALDQFVTSRLNRGIYDHDYIQANLNLLKHNAELALKYGLKPGLTCFEPRSVPDALLEKYPMLRGARVDHPIRSWHPRFNLSIAHPVVREHYAEMMETLMKEVPALDYIAVWSNDSGAGFEYTSSLYVGRNGGGYVIREWKGDTEIAQSAAHNMMRFQKLLRDAGRNTNPEFRSLMRLEAFWTEHQWVWEQLEDGVNVETSSLVSKGWDVDYTHPRYKDRKAVAGTALFNTLAPQEKTALQDLRSKGSDAEVYFWPGTFWNHEPLLGIPFPKLVHERLVAMVTQGVRAACFAGGTTPPSIAPYNINEEIVRAFQADGSLNLDAFLKQKALQWAGKTLADDLVSVWTASDDAYRAFPVPVQIYSGWGVWYRLLVRPIIPDVEKVPEKERRYYEDFLLAPPHNRCRVDFRYDVGFDLVTPEDAMRCLKLINENVLPRAAQALEQAGAMKTRATTEAERALTTDLYDRMAALHCWYRNQRNVTAWIAGVHTYAESNDPAVKQECRRILRDMVLDEIENTRVLLRHWETASTQWIVVSEVGETTFIYYTNFGELLKRKIELMQGRENDEPYVDPNFQWRVPGINWEVT